MDDDQHARHPKRHPRRPQADPLPDEGPAYGSENEDENTEPAISRMGGSDEEGEDLMENMDGYDA